jgi:hypothetical protein
MHRTEFYEWLLSLSVGDRLIRHGCDRHFRRLHKQARKVKRPRAQDIQRKKKRYLPGHLEPHAFGGAKWDHKDVPPPYSRIDRNRNTVNPGDDYYEEEPEDE